MEYGIQLYSVRDVLPEDMEGTLQKISAMGYRFVEFAGFFGKSARDVKAMLDRYDLRISGTHTGWQEIVENWEETVAYHKAIGNKHIIIPGAELGTKEQIEAFVETVNDIQPKLQKEGIRLGYHNHDFEFKANTDGIVPYDEIVGRTNIYLEIDTFWAYAGGKDPVEMMEALKERLIFIHIKDGYENGDGVPLGLGTAPVKAVYQKAEGMGIPMVVESETLNPDGLTEAKTCIDFLISLEK